MQETNAIQTPTILGQDGYSGVNSTFGKDLAAFSLAYTDDDIQYRRCGDKLYRMSCRHYTLHYFLCEIMCHNWYNFNGDFAPINLSSSVLYLVLVHIPYSVLVELHVKVVGT
jgi:hypothetical protein